METQIISQATVKPSSPTPPNLKIFKLSLLDQLIPAPYAPIVLFYPNSNGSNHAQILKRVEKLKNSLSETLTLFFPLAGKIRDDLTIDCNDDGAYVATAKVNCQLFQFLKRPDLELICKFLPCDVGFVGSMVGTRVTNIQINLFECGGMAVGICISHRILDGAALNRFLHGWAAAAVDGGETVVPDPDFDAGPAIFPATDLWLRDSAMAMWGASFKAGSSVTRRFVFDSPAIATLKSMADGSGRANPTRVEAISAFLWKSIMAAGGPKKKASILTHVVNLRKRAGSILSEHSIGNLIWISGAKSPEVKSLPALADAVKLSISNVNSDYIKKMRGKDGSGLMRKALKEIEEFGSGSGSGSKADYLAFSSWVGFDFGWGKPAWVSSYALSAPVFLNLVILMETKFGDGIEAWVTLDEQEMEALQHDQEFLDFVSVDPSPLEMCYSRTLMESEYFLRQSDKNINMIRDCKNIEDSMLKFVNVKVQD